MTRFRTPNFGAFGALDTALRSMVSHVSLVYAYFLQRVKGLAVRHATSALPVLPNPGPTVLRLQRDLPGIPPCSTTAVLRSFQYWVLYTSLVHLAPLVTAEEVMQGPTCVDAKELYAEVVQERPSVTYRKTNVNQKSRIR